MKTPHSNPVPYDTGKVQIGKYYQRPVHPSSQWSREEFDIQSVLLGDRRPALRGVWGVVPWHLLLCIGAVTLVLSQLSKAFAS